MLVVLLFTVLLGELFWEMEQLSKTQQTAIRKASSDRLRLLLLKDGYEEEVVLAFNRDELMSKNAECLLADPFGGSDHEGEDVVRNVM